MTQVSQVPSHRAGSVGVSAPAEDFPSFCPSLHHPSIHDPHINHPPIHRPTNRPSACSSVHPSICPLTHNPSLIYPVYLSPCSPPPPTEDLKLLFFMSSLFCNSKAYSHFLIFQRIKFSPECLSSHSTLSGFLFPFIWQTPWRKADYGNGRLGQCRRKQSCSKRPGSQGSDPTSLHERGCASVCPVCVLHKDPNYLVAYQSFSNPEYLQSPFLHLSSLFCSFCL